MDNSETFIKMCEKAEEIQSHKITDGDYYAQPHKIGSHKYMVDWYFECTGGFRWDSLSVIWLPRQDQLQAMLSYQEPKDRKVCDWFCFGVPGYYWSDDFGYGDIDDKEIQYYRKFTSMEQLWLAFYMSERYKKQWDGELWKRL